MCVCVCVCGLLWSRSERVTPCVYVPAVWLVRVERKHRSGPTSPILLSSGRHHMKLGWTPTKIVTDAVSTVSMGGCLQFMLLLAITNLFFFRFCLIIDTLRNLKILLVKYVGFVVPSFQKGSKDKFISKRLHNPWLLLSRLFGCFEVGENRCSHNSDSDKCEQCNMQKKPQSSTLKGFFN